MSGFIREHVVKRLTRSSKWPAARKEHIKHHPKCEVCGNKRNRQVHHKQPFYLFPKQELNPRNLITLCNRHHLTFGHLQYWKSYNEHIVADCYEWQLKIQNRPKG